jgi:hypothetical protein
MTDRMMRHMAAFCVTASALLTTVAFVVASPPSPAAATVDGSAANNGECPTLSASGWQLPYSPYTKGTVYDVTVNGYSCAKADGYITKLVATKVSGGFPTTVKGGPKGWKCTASKSKTGLAYTGQCSKKALSIGGTFFSWTVG